MRLVVSVFFLLLSFSATAQLERIEPPNWWVGMKDQSLQLMLKGENLKQFDKVRAYSKGIEVLKTHQADHSDYLFVDLRIDPNVNSGKHLFVLQGKAGHLQFEYELQKRKYEAQDFLGFDSSDAIYLITPDRFANGNPKNDVVLGMRESDIDRGDDYKRHGGDIQGILDHLDYIEKMGFTAIWSSPLLENDMKEQSYHGYAITDFYKVDPRFGTLDTYKELAEEMRKRGMKLIMDQVANHAGLSHWFMKDLPFKDWINQQKAYEKGDALIFSNHRRTTNQDTYASEVDKIQMNEGWFVPSMPDLNQNNAFMAEYITQNSIWWIETLKLGGIRQDTYPYPDKNFMSYWTQRIMNEYPNFSIVGEEWSYNPLLVGYWQDASGNKDGYRSKLDVSMDFPLQKAMVKALTEKESWDKGLVKLHEGLANDFGYGDPLDLMVFGDNHDMDRLFTQLGEDYKLQKTALSILSVLPRIPQFYYGTEIGMQNTAKPGDHGLIRTDFPGGFKGDTQNAFTGKNLSPAALDLQQFTRDLLQFRKKTAVLHSGKTKHFAPKDGLYVLSRYTTGEQVVLLVNKKERERGLDLAHYSEMNFDQYHITNALTQEVFQDASDIRVGANSSLLLHFKKKVKKKEVIYQVFTRLFGAKGKNAVPWGTKAQNSVGKFSDFTDQALKEIADLGVTTIWYTGVLHHASVTDYSAYGIPADDADVVKGRAGSPYAIRDYYNVDPDLATDVNKRLEEFKALVERTHNNGMKVIIDMVPNHVARGYKSLTKPEEILDLGEDDDTTVEYHKDNNFYYLPGVSFQTPDWQEGFIPLGGKQPELVDKKFEEYPAKWTGNGARSAKPNVHDWYETVKINFGVQPDGTKDFPELGSDYAFKTTAKHAEFWKDKQVPNTWIKMRQIAEYWLGLGVDGFRFDMAEMVPVEFWSYLNSSIKAINMDAILLAEVYNPKLYRDYLKKGKMDYLYDKVDLYDSLKHIMKGYGWTDHIHTVQQELNDIDGHMLRFLENHDEQRIASPEFAGDAEIGKPAMVVSATLNSAPVMLYFGQEVGEDGSENPGFGKPSRTSIFDYVGVPNHQAWMNEGAFDGGQLTEDQKQLRTYYQKILKAVHKSDAFLGPYIENHYYNKAHTDTYDHRIFSFVRYDDKEVVLVVSNFDKDKNYAIDLKLDPSIVSLLELKQEDYDLSDLLTDETAKLRISEGIGQLSIDLKPLESRIFLFKR